ncbi:amino acid adenylation domain-containing protein [Amycolatopsis sp. DG1A-15b]|uniref:amino acid adenylation domain-containing protein n=1 Tax=Amycolatopsis sp. DG1A-15b TaxID=3052846 RepID=UPI00255BC749|nr:amino acid adenylation domain-containing protein [Amycolatopsis sp. DG1A-15b]WIX92015.1 amino acid adenylation domain-containing protein [Amycolatopsis sp. DG1A-15b]
METLEGPDEHTVELWAQRLAKVPTVLEVPSGKRRPPPAPASGRRQPIELSARTEALLRELSRTANVPPSSVLFAAFGLTLARLTGVRTLLVGVGDPADPIPVRLDIDDDLTPEAFTRRVRESLAWSLDRDGFPLDDVVTRLGVERSGRSHPLVQVFVALPGRPGAQAPAAGPRFDIAVRLEDTGGSFADCAADLWEEDEAQRFFQDCSAAAEQLAEALVAAGPRVTLADIRCLSARSRAILDTINDTGVVLPGSSVDQLFRDAADRWPSAVAVRDADSVLTYAELAVAVAEQARLLRAAGVGEGDTVLIAVPRSVAEVVAVLGTLWVGAAYFGADLAQPASHTARILAKARPAAAIAAGDAAGRLGVPLIGSWHRGWEVGGEAAAPVQPDPDRLAYVAFTSGSTGAPKGVAIPHRGVLRLVHDGKHLALGPGERSLRLAPLAFDASTLEIWGTLLTGATLEICPPDVLLPNEIGAFLEERRVTVAFLTAGLFGLVHEFASRSFAGLRHLMTGGDVVPHEHVKQALAENPGLVITNCYGPTENTVVTTSCSVRESADVDGPLPIGSPIRGTQVHVLDHRGRLLMPGAVGELYTAGAGLASGYLNDRAETDRAFGFFSPDVPARLYRTGDLVRLDGAGRLHFLGRADDQVKVRGFRIELSAIAEVLRAQDGVEESFVTVTEGDSTDKRLVAAVRLTPGAAVTPVGLRDRLRDELPSYMVPALWAVVDQLPITTTGKIDRRRLVAAARPVGWFAKQGRRAA